MLGFLSRAGRFLIKNRLTRGAGAVSEYVFNNRATRGAAQVGQFANNNYYVIDSILSKLNSLVDSFTHVITVKVVGGPAADLRRVYYLACAAAFGRFSNGVSRVTGSYFEMSCSTDVTDKSVQITIGYNTGIIGDLRRAATNGPVRTPLDVMFEGPDQVTVGRGWSPVFFESKGAGRRYGNITPGTTIRGGSVKSIPVTSELDVPADIRRSTNTGTLTIPVQAGLDWVVVQQEVLRRPKVPLAPFRPFAWQVNPGVADVLRERPVISKDSTGRRVLYMRRVVPETRGPYTTVITDNTAKVPVLPDDGRVITTGETRNYAVQPPRPPVDGIARGSLLALTVQALTNPGYLPALPRLTSTALGSGGLYLNPPGLSVPDPDNPGGQVVVVRTVPPPLAGDKPSQVIFGIPQEVFVNDAVSPKRPDAPLLRDPSARRLPTDLLPDQPELRGD